RNWDAPGGPMVTSQILGQKRQIFEDERVTSGRRGRARPIELRRITVAERLAFARVGVGQRVAEVEVGARDRKPAGVARVELEARRRFGAGCACFPGLIAIGAERRARVARGWGGAGARVVVKLRRGARVVSAA